MKHASEFIDIDALTDNHEIIHTDKFGDCVTVVKAIQAVSQAQKEAYNEAIDKIMPFIPECFEKQVLNHKL